jgi:hypothetical protein
MSGQCVLPMAAKIAWDRALVTRAGQHPIAVLGRAASLHPAILAGFRAAEPELDVRLENPDAALAAARLAARGIMQPV